MAAIFRGWKVNQPLSHSPSQMPCYSLRAPGGIVRGFEESLELTRINPGISRSGPPTHEFKLPGVCITPYLRIRDIGAPFA